MKKYLFLILIQLSCICMAQGNYTINGQLSKNKLLLSPDKTIDKVYLCAEKNGILIKIDSAQVVNNSFFFKGTTPTPIEMYYVTGFDNGNIPLFLENGNIIIKPFDAAYPSGAQVTGTINNDILSNFYKLKYDERADMIKASNKLMESLPDSIKKNKDLLYEYQKALFNANTVRSTLKTLQYAIDNSDNIAGLYILDIGGRKIFNSKQFQYKVLPIFENKHSNHPLYQNIYNVVLGENMKSGRPVPNIIARSPRGQVIKLTDFRGKYVLLDFWASWCGPCRREIPHIKEAVETINKNGAKDFVVLSFSLDNDKEAWQRAIHKLGLDMNNWYHFSDLQGWQSPLIKPFGVTSIPKIFLINPEGQLIMSDLRGDAIVEKVKNIISGKESYN